MLKTRLIASMSVTALTLAACAPQTTTPNNPQAPATETPAAPVVQSDVILTQESQGVENPITPEQIQSIKIGDRMVSQSQIQIVKGDFTTQQLNGDDLEVQYVWDTSGGVNVGVFRFLSRFGSIGKVEITYEVDGQTKTFSFVAGEGTTGAAAQDDLRITVKSDGTLVGGVAGADGSLDQNKPRFKTTADQKLEVFNGDTKTVFDLNAAGGSDGEVTAESTAAASEEEKAGLTVDPVSPISLFVGKWKANLLGREIKATVRDGGSGRVDGSATVDGKPYSASGDYTARTNTELEITGSSGDTTLKFKAQLTTNNVLTLSLTDAGGVADLQPFVGIPVNLQRDI